MKSPKHVLFEKEAGDWIATREKVPSAFGRGLTQSAALTDLVVKLADMSDLALDMEDEEAEAIEEFLDEFYELNGE